MFHHLLPYFTLPLVFLLTPCLTKDIPKELQDPALFCDGCFATVTEVSADLVNRQAKRVKLKTRINTALDNVCHTDKLRAYKFSPPTQVIVILD